MTRDECVACPLAAAARHQSRPDISPVRRIVFAKWQNVQIRGKPFNVCQIARWMP